MACTYVKLACFDTWIEKNIFNQIYFYHTHNLKQTLNFTVVFHLHIKNTISVEDNHNNYYLE